jgi:hypothetical protein
MIDTCFFTCPNKGKTLAVYFDDPKELTQEYLSQFTNDERIDRYIELIFRNNGKQTVSSLIKQELTIKPIVEEIIDCLVNNKDPEMDII